MARKRWIRIIGLCMFWLVAEAAWAQTPGELKWSFELDGSYMYSSPATDENGVVYVGDYKTQLWAIQPDGSRKWTFISGSWSHDESLPAVGRDGVVYLASFDTLFAVSSNGSKLWEFEAGGVLDSSPAIGGDDVIYIGSNDRKVYAVNPDGTLKWTYDTGGIVNSSPAVGPDGSIYVGSYDNHLYALGSDGALKWKFDAGDTIRSSPAIDGEGTVYIGSYDNHLYAIHSNGALKWKYETGGGIASAPVIGEDGSIFVVSKDKNVYAVSPEGVLKWSYALDSYSSFRPPNPTVGADGTVYVCSYKTLYAISSAGEPAWTFETEEDLSSSPAIASNGVVYVRDDNKLYAINCASQGLAASPWPKFRNNNRNTGKVEKSLHVAESTSFHLFNPGDVIRKTFQVSNIGDENITVSRMEFDHPGFSLESALPITLEAGGARDLTAGVAPDVTGLYQCVLKTTYKSGGQADASSAILTIGVFLADGGETALKAQQALAGYTACAALDSESACSRNNLAVLHRLLGKATMAESLLMDALLDSLNAGDGYAGVKMNLGLVKSDRRQWPDSNGYFQKALKDVAEDYPIAGPEPQSSFAPQLYYNIAREYYRVKYNLTKAVDMLDIVVSHGLANDLLKARAFVLRGVIHIYQENPTAAEADFQQAVALDPSGPVGDLARNNLDPPDCTEFKDNLDLDIRLGMGGSNYGFTLKFTPVAGDPAGLYWKLDMTSLGPLPHSEDGCMAFGDNFALSVCADYLGLLYEFTLRFRSAAEDPTGLYWKLDPTTFVRKE